MTKKEIYQKIYDDRHVAKSVVFNSEKELVKHIIWKDFESAKRYVTDLVDSKESLSPSEVISEVHFYLADMMNFLRSSK